MASPGPALFRLTMPSRTAPHRSVSLSPLHHPSLCAPHRPCCHPGPGYLLCPPTPHPPSFCAVTTHSLLLPPVPSPWSRGPLCPFLIPSKISTFPGALSHLAHSGCSCPQDSPPPPRAPSVPAVSAAAAFSSLCTFLFPCGPFSGRNGTFLQGSSRESRRAREHERGREREESEVVRE